MSYNVSVTVLATINEF